MLPIAPTRDDDLVSTESQYACLVHVPYGEGKGIRGKGKEAPLAHAFDVRGWLGIPFTQRSHHLDAKHLWECGENRRFWESCVHQAMSVTSEAADEALRWIRIEVRTSEGVAKAVMLTAVPKALRAQVLGVLRRWFLEIAFDVGGCLLVLTTICMLHLDAKHLWECGENRRFWESCVHQATIVTSEAAGERLRWWRIEVRVSRGVAKAVMLTAVPKALRAQVLGVVTSLAS